MDNPRHTFVHGDIADAAVSGPLVERPTSSSTSRPRRTSIARSWRAGDFIRTDVEGTFVLLEAARRAKKLRRFVQISTDEVYGSVPTGASVETDELKPRNPYAASKAGADRLAYSYWATYEVPVIITRASNNYGPYQFPEKVIPLFVTNAIDDIPVPLYGDGKNVRDWLHVLDHCRAVDLLIERGDGRRGLQHRRRQRRHEHRPDAPDLDALGKPRSLIKPVADRPGHDRRYCLDTTKLRGIGWAPQVPFEDGLRRHRRVVPPERMVVAPDQGAATRRSGPTTRRSTNKRQVELHGSVLITGATGFAGGHLVEHARRARIEHRRLGPICTPRPEIARLATCADRRSARSRAGRDARFASLRPAAIYHSPARRTSPSRGATRTSRSRATCWRRSICSTPLRRAASRCRVLVTGSAAVYAPSDTPITEERPSPPATRTRSASSRRSSWRCAPFAEDGLRHRDGPVLQSHRAAADASVRRAKHGAADRADRNGRRRAGDPGRQPRRPARLHRRARRRARLRRAHAAREQRRRSTTSPRVSDASVRSLLDALESRARVPVRIEVDPARHAAQRNIPSLVGDYYAPSRPRPAGNPDISFDQMLDDLLDYWRAKLQAARVRRATEGASDRLMANIRRNYVEFAMEIAPLLFDLGHLQAHHAPGRGPGQGRRRRRADRGRFAAPTPRAIRRSGAARR